MSSVETFDTNLSPVHLRQRYLSFYFPFHEFLFVLLPRQFLFCQISLHFSNNLLTQLFEFTALGLVQLYLKLYQRSKSVALKTMTEKLPLNSQKTKVRSHKSAQN